MNDELFDAEAYVCTDCLVLIANGDEPDFAYQYPDKTEDEAFEMLMDYRTRIDDTMRGYRITTGWGREQHECASNVIVWPLYREEGTVDEHTEGDAREYRAEFVSEAVSQAEFDFPDAIGFKAASHDLETEGDRGGECECETDNFSERTCDHYGTHYAGTWHAATIWKITEG